MIRIGIWGIVGVFGGLLLALVFSVQFGTVMMLSGWTEADVEAMATVQVIAGLILGGAVGMIWGFRRNRGGGALKAFPPRKHRRDTGG